MNTTSPNLYLGTSSWSCKDWRGKFYPEHTKPTEFIREYAKHFRTVEVDSTFYGTPKQTTLEHWHDLTPDAFIFSVKAPERITHESLLINCETDLNHFLKALKPLGTKLGPILFQFPYFAKRSGMTEDEFLHRLREFAKILPVDTYRFAIEVRNKNWLNPYLYEILHDHGLTLALIDHPWMSTPDQLFHSKDVITGSFAYIRWLGDRKGIEQRTTTWNECIVDREADMKRWVAPIQSLLERKMDVFGYVNNHYAGYAPENVMRLDALLAEPQDASSK